MSREVSLKPYMKTSPKGGTEVEKSLSSLIFPYSLCTVHTSHTKLLIHYIQPYTNSSELYEVNYNIHLPSFNLRNIFKSLKMSQNIAGLKNDARNPGSLFVAPLAT